MISEFSHQLIEANRYFNSELSAYFESIGEGEWLPIAMILLFSFAYGVVHALGPGHGKALLSGYLLAHPRLPTSQVFQIGIFIALVHALSALLLTLGATYLIHTSATKLLRDITVPMAQVSGGLIVLMGCWLLYEVIASRTKIKECIDPKKKLSVILLSGIVPCPGVMTLSFFAITLGELSVGMIAALCMSLGMGLTISVVGLMAHRISTAHVITHQPSWFLALRILGTLMVIGIGLILLSQSSTKPF